LSTAMFDGAVTNTLHFYYLTNYKIDSTTVVVLPVPGGPWITDKWFYSKELWTAFICYSFKL